MPLRHVVMLTYDDECDVDAVVEGIRSLRAQIPEIRELVVGRDIGLAEGNATVVVVADFDDEAAWQAYQDHPAHKKVVVEFVLPHRIGRASMQHWM